jgi:lipopolysaccharide transport system permease protein
MTPLRASWAAPLLDAAIAAAAVLLAYRLRFDPGVLPTFLPGAARIAPFAGVLIPLVLAAGGLYRAGANSLWPLRLMVGVAAGMGLTALITDYLFGFVGVSRFAFAAASLLIVLGCGGWRAADGLRVLAARARLHQRVGLLEERSADAPSLGLGLVRLFGYRELVRNLVTKDLKLKYRGSVLGFVWSLANPILMLAVYSVVFTYILRIRRDNFAFFLLIGLLPWTFFAGTTAMATGTVVDSGGLLKSVRFPRAVLPIATVLFNLSQYLLTFGVLLPLMLVVFGVPLASPMVAFPAVLALLLLFTVGVALVVSSATVFFRDVRHFVEIALGVLFWATPIVYDVSDLPERLRLPVLMTPLSAFISALHDIFYFQVWPDLSVWLIAVAWSLTMFIGGITVFLSFEDRFAEHV